MQESFPGWSAILKISWIMGGSTVTRTTEKHTLYFESWQHFDLKSEISQIEPQLFLVSVYIC